MSILNSGLRAVAVVALILSIAGGWGCAPSSDPEVKIEPRAAELLKMMSEALGTSEELAITAERSIAPEFIEGRAAMETAKIAVTIARPNRLVGRAVGADDERIIYYNGKTFVLHDVGTKVYGLAEFEGTLDAMFDEVEKKFGIEPPLSAFLRSDPYTKLLEHVTGGKFVAEETVDGAPRHHLHFTEELIDWDLWTTVADDLPHRLVITAKTIEGKPEVRIDFKNVDMSPKIDLESFTFTPVDGLILAEMMNSDDLE